MKGPIQSVEVSYFVHATEDEARVKEAVGSALGLAGPGEEEVLEGYFGNKITSVTYHLTGEAAEEFVAGLASRMGPKVKEELRRSLVERLDEHSAMYFRLDKQMLMEGELGLGSRDAVRVKIKPRTHLVKGREFEVFKEELGLDER